MAISVKTVHRPARTWREQIYLVEIWRGLFVTSVHLFINLSRHFRRLLGLKGKAGAVTVQYPDEAAILGHRARTRHVLLAREDGSPRCTACLLCETICPAKCIRITPEESPDINVEKRAKTFDIDLGLCVFCGYCVEACPVDAIHMDSNKVEVCGYNRSDLLWTIDDMMGRREKPFSEPPQTPTEPPFVLRRTP